MIGRSFLLLFGVGAIAASAHISIMSSGGYHSLLSIRIAALAALLVAGAYGVRYAWDRNMRAIAAVTFLVLLAGEAFVILMSATQQATAIEAAQAPARAIEKGRADAQRRLERAEAAVATAPISSDRLAQAAITKTAADRAVIERAADRGCASNCRALLEQQVSAAGRELEAARDEIATSRRKLEIELADARSAMRAFTSPAARNPVALYLGISEIEFALLSSILASLALNAGGTLVLAIAMHGHPVPTSKRHFEPQSAIIADAELVVAPPAAPRLAISQSPAVEPVREAQEQRRPRPPSLAKHVAEFIRDRLKHSPGSMIEIRDIHRNYVEWCRANGIEARPIGEVMPKVTDTLMTLGIRGTVIEGVPYARDVAIRQAALVAA